MELTTVHDVHMAINNAHRFIYFVPEAAESYSTLGVNGRGGYFGSRSAPMGAVTEPVVVATFYNFSPAAITAARIDEVWNATTPEALQAARFDAAGRVLDRVGYQPADEDIVAARAILDPVVAGLSHAGKPLAAGNAAVALPDDPRVALWQQITVIREWRGDAHIAVLQAADVDPCAAVVLQVGSGRVGKALAATRAWTDDEWAATVAELVDRGWADDSGALTTAGSAAREQIEADTDRLCAPMWTGVSDADGRRLIDLLAPIDAAMVTADVYAALR